MPEDKFTYEKHKKNIRELLKGTQPATNTLQRIKELLRQRRGG